MKKKTTGCDVKAVKQKMRSTVMADETPVSSSCTRRRRLKAKPDVSLVELSGFSHIVFTRSRATESRCLDAKQDIPKVEQETNSCFSRTVFTRHQGNGGLRDNIAGHVRRVHF